MRRSKFAIQEDLATVRGRMRVLTGTPDGPANEDSAELRDLRLAEAHLVIEHCDWRRASGLPEPDGHRASAEAVLRTLDPRFRSV